MLDIQQIEVYYGEAQTLHGVSLKIGPGEIVSVLGANGAGKSTIMNTISGLNKVKNGRIFFDGQPIEHLSFHERVSRGIIQVPEGRKLFPEMTVFENLEMGAYHREARKKFKENLTRVFEIFPVLEERKNQPAGTLSGGEQQMLAIGRGLVGIPKMLMLDEPSLGLSPLLVKHVFQVVAEINRLGITILLVEQNVKLALKISSRSYILRQGSIVMEGRSSDLLDHDEVKKAYLGEIT
ncbi:MAG: ABC transporter ATP-binding protein [Deltaproteobacteria bacterium]|nr:ABC transporter ATP-binding protein [Deltaproteobacteria bacterium]